MLSFLGKKWPLIAGYGLAVLMFLAWQNARENLAASYAECNTRVETGRADAEKAAREAEMAALERHQARETQLVQLAEQSLKTADMARQNVKTNIKEVIREIPTNDCANQPVMPALRGLYAD